MKKQQAEHDTLQVAYEGGQQELQGVLRDIENVKRQTAVDAAEHKHRMRAQFKLLQGAAGTFSSASDSLVAALD